jgi:hypothetical protein
LIIHYHHRHHRVSSYAYAACLVSGCYDSARGTSMLSMSPAATSTMARTGTDARTGALGGDRPSSQLGRVHVGTTVSLAEAAKYVC